MVSNEDEIKKLQARIDDLKRYEIYEKVIEFMERKNLDINVEPLMAEKDSYYALVGFDKDRYVIAEFSVEKSLYKEIGTVEWAKLIDYWKAMRNK